MAANYHWPLVHEFINRANELDVLDRWWKGSERQPVVLMGRRRVGKSWLFRRFAHEKPALLLIAEQLPPGTQLSRFADVLEPALGVRPDLPMSQLCSASYFERPTNRNSWWSSTNFRGFSESATPRSDEH